MLRDLPYADPSCISAVVKHLERTERCPTFVKEWKKRFDMNHRWFGKTGNTWCNTVGVCTLMEAMHKQPAVKGLTELAVTLRDIYNSTMDPSLSRWMVQEFDYSNYK